MDYTFLTTAVEARILSEEGAKSAYETKLKGILEVVHNVADSGHRSVTFSKAFNVWNYYPEVIPDLRELGYTVTQRRFLFKSFTIRW